MAFAAAGGSTAAGFPVGALGGVPPLPGFDIPFGRIDLVGITLDVIGPGGSQGPAEPGQLCQRNFGVGQGSRFDGTNLPVDSARHPVQGRQAGAATAGW